MGLSFKEDFDGREKEKLMVFAACISSLRIAGDDGQGKKVAGEFFGFLVRVFSFGREGAQNKRPLLAEEI